MDKLGVTELTAFRAELLAKALKLKSVRNIIDAHFRAFWRDYMNATETDRNPFARLQWPRIQREKPDPFSAEERDAILVWLKDNDFFYFPMIFVLFSYRHEAERALRF